MFNKNRFSQLTSIIFACLFLLIGVTTGYAQKNAKGETKLQVFITGIPGDGVGGAIDAVGSDQLATQTVISTGGSGGGAGKVDFGPLVITKSVDRATPKLFLACATATHLAQARIDWISNSGGKNDQVFFSVLLEDVLITSVRSGLPNQNDPNLTALGPVEQVGLSFRAIQWTFFLPDGTQIKGGFDVAGNKQL